MIFRSAARWIVSAVLAAPIAALVTLAIGAGVDPDTAASFGAQTTEFAGEAIFILLTVGGAKLMGMVKKIDPAKWSEIKWAQKAGKQVKNMPAYEAEAKIKNGTI